MSVSNPIKITKGSGVISRGAPRIPGTFPSTLRYGEQVLSTGIPSLDSLIGGGLPPGTICLIKDNFPSLYADCVLKSFIAEGASYNHHLFLASGREKCEDHLLNSLPGTVSSSKKDEKPEVALGEGDALKIAWRYGHQQQGGGGGAGKDSKFDFSKKVTAAELGAKHVSCSRTIGTAIPSLENDDVAKRSQEFLQEILSCVSAFKIPTTSQEKHPTNLLRICLSHCEEHVLSPKFMMGLRALVRKSNSCAVITVSDAGYSSERMRRCQHFADTVFALQAVTNEKRRTELGDIDAVCDVVKISSVNSLKLVESPRDIGLSFKKKRIFFHELNLPPEGENTAQREISKSTPSSMPVSSSTSCGVTVKGKAIDF